MEEDEQADLLERAAAGDPSAISDLIAMNRQRLLRMVQLRLDRRLYGRVDASDIVQEASIEAARRFREYAQQPDMDLFVWLRWLTGEKLIDAHRHHLGVQKRDAGREVSIQRPAMPEATSLAIADQLFGKMTTPTQAARRGEVQQAVQAALNQLDPTDREVLILRHFEQLSNEETAQALGLKKSGASKRYVTALRRLKKVIDEFPEFQS